MSNHLEPHKDHELTYTEVATTVFRARITEDGEGVEAAKSVWYEVNSESLWCVTCHEPVNIEDVSIEVEYLQ